MHCEFPGIEQSRDPGGVFCKEICLWIFPSKWNRKLFVRLTSSQLIWRTTLLFDTISISLLLQHRISQATLPAFVCRCYLKNCSGIFLLHRFLASEIHSCEEVGVLIRRMLLLELACVVVLPCLWMLTCALEIRWNFWICRKLISEDLYIYNYKLLYFAVLLNK